MKNQSQNNLGVRKYLLSFLSLFLGVFILLSLFNIAGKFGKLLFRFAQNGIGSGPSFFASWNKSSFDK
jgi:hypothetical protein